MCTRRRAYRHVVRRGMRFFRLRAARSRRPPNSSTWYKSHEIAEVPLVVASTLARDAPCASIASLYFSREKEEQPRLEQGGVKAGRSCRRRRARQRRLWQSSCAHLSARSIVLFLNCVTPPASAIDHFDLFDLFFAIAFRRSSSPTSRHRAPLAHSSLRGVATAEADLLNAFTDSEIPLDDDPLVFIEVSYDRVIERGRTVWSRSLGCGARFDKSAETNEKAWTASL